MERIVRATGAVPATVAVLNGRLTVGQSVLLHFKYYLFRAHTHIYILSASEK